MDLLIKNARIITPDKILTDHLLCISRGKIKDILLKKPYYSQLKRTVKTIDAGGLYVSPGLVDIHIQGFKGEDVWSGPESVFRLSRSLLSSGTTSFVPTTHFHEQTIRDIIQARARLEEDTPVSEILGIHLEGPFINPLKKGMIPLSSIQRYNPRLLDNILKLTQDQLILMTIAPEMPNSAELIKQLKKKRIVIAAGHTKADFEQANQSFKQGVSQITHLFNAMEPIHHRKPGGIMAALLNPGISVQIIVDGHHIHPAVLQLVLELKSSDNVILITDAVKAAGLKDGYYKMSGQTICLKKGKVVSKRGILSGSALSLLGAVKNMLKFTHVSLAEAIKMATLTPARSIGFDRRKGSLTKGKDADLIFLNDKLQIRGIIKNGKIITLSL